MGRRVSFADPAQLESVREFIKEEEEREKSGESYQSGAQSEGVPAGFGLVEETSVDVIPMVQGGDAELGGSNGDVYV